MKVLWLTESYPPSMGGVQQYLKNTIVNLPSLTSVVVTRRRKGEVAGPSAGVGETVYRLDGWPQETNPTVLYRCPWTLLRFCVSVLRIAHQEGVALVVVGQISFPLLVALWALTVARFPAAIIFHGEDVPVVPLRSNPLTKYLVGRADLFVCNSRFTSERLARFLGGGDRSFILTPGVEERFFAGADPAVLHERYGLAGRRVIYTVGRLDLRKGHDRVLDVLPELVQELPELIYLIGGSGANESRLREQVRNLKLEEHVLFCGFVPEHEIVAFHHLGEIFVMPNRNLEDGDAEGFGIVFLEANACGKPVIGGACGGVPDAVEDGATGFLVDPGNPDLLRDRLRYLLLNPDQARRLGGAGRQRAWQGFRWSLLAPLLEEALLNMVHHSRKGDKQL